MWIDENDKFAKLMKKDGFIRSDGSGLWIDFSKPVRNGLWNRLKGFRKMARLEHVNLTVKDPRASADLFSRIFGWKIRWEGSAINNGYTIHLGNKETYIAIYSGSQTPLSEKRDDTYRTIGGLNHIGVVVSDIDAVELKVRNEGLIPHMHADYEPGKRFYFNDINGIEIEVVSYS